MQFSFESYFVSGKFDLFVDFLVWSQTDGKSPRFSAYLLHFKCERFPSTFRWRKNDNFLIASESFSFQFSSPFTDWSKNSMAIENVNFEKYFR